MSVQEPGVATARPVDLRPTLMIALTKVGSAIADLVTFTLAGDTQIQTWARTERVSWYEGQRHNRPERPDWHGGY